MDALNLIIQMGVTVLNGLGLMTAFQIFAAGLVALLITRVVIQRFQQRK